MSVTQAAKELQISPVTLLVKKWSIGTAGKYFECRDGFKPYIEEVYKPSAEEINQLNLEKENEKLKKNIEKEIHLLKEERINRINNYRSIKNPTREQLAQHIDDIEKEQAEIEKDAKNKEKMQEDSEKYQKKLDDIVHPPLNSDTLKDALRNDHLNRALGIY